MKISAFLCLDQKLNRFMVAGVNGVDSVNVQNRAVLGSVTKQGSAIIQCKCCHSLKNRVNI